MGKLFEIYFKDLSEDCQKRFEECIGKDHNYDAFPIVELYYEEENN